MPHYAKFHLGLHCLGVSGTLTDSEEPNELLHMAAVHQGLHCLLRKKQTSRQEIHHFIEYFDWQTP